MLISVVAPLQCTTRKPTRCVKRRFRRTWRIQLHLCRGKLEADAAQLAGKPYADGQLIWWLQRDHGLRQSQSGRYDPQLNSSNQQWAEHYGVVVLPARPRRPQDSAKVEVSAQIVERWVLARLRHCRFCSLAQLNTSIKELLEELNCKSFKQMLSNRLDTFKRLSSRCFDP